MLGNSWWVGISLIFTSFVDPRLLPRWAISDSPGRVCHFISLLPHSALISIMVLILAHGNYLCVCLLDCSIFRSRESFRWKVLNKCLLDEWISTWKMNEWWKRAISSLAVAFLTTVHHHQTPKFGAMVITPARHCRRASLSLVLYQGFSYKALVASLFFFFPPQRDGRVKTSHPSHLEIHVTQPVGLTQHPPLVKLGHIGTVASGRTFMKAAYLELLSRVWGRWLWEKKEMAFAAGPKEVWSS